MNDCLAFAFALVASAEGSTVSAADQVYMDNFFCRAACRSRHRWPRWVTISARQSPTRKWAPEMHMGSGGRFTQTNGLLQFLGTDTAIRPWIGSVCTYTQDWQVTLDVNLGNIVLTQNDSHAQVFLAVANQNDTAIQNGFPGDHLSIALDLYRTPAGETAELRSLSANQLDRALSQGGRPYQHAACEPSRQLQCGQQDADRLV